ncbi:MAG: hypothetical protein EOP82_30340, partial [Variovorax sp.]
MSAEMKRQARARAARLGVGPQRLFRWLEEHRLPVTVERLESVNALRTLLAAGFVEAQIPEPTHKRGRTEQPPAAPVRIFRTAERLRGCVAPVRPKAPRSRLQARLGLRGAADEG